MDDPRDVIALAAIGALVIDDERGREAAKFWAECLVEAASAEGVAIPHIGLYTADRVEYYGFQIGPWASRVDCGFMVDERHEVIRVLDRRGDLHLWDPVAMVFRWFGLHRGEDWYFGLEGWMTIGIKIGDRDLVDNYYGKSGREAIVYAIRQALAYYK